MKNHNKIFIISIIIFLFIVPALADDIEWVDPQEKTLRFMESVTRDGFIIEASDFMIIAPLFLYMIHRII